MTILERRFGEADAAVMAASNLRETANLAANDANKALIGVHTTHAESDAEMERAKRELAAARTRFDRPPSWPTEGNKGKPGFEELCPGNSPELDLARERVFIAAVAVHRSFMAVTAPLVNDNLALFRKLHSFPDGGKIAVEVGGQVWDTLFIAVPVVSSTFASIASLTAKSMDTGHLGWLLVDEAGQAVPQMAVGALMRSRRALVVGDPLQIKPVSTMAKPLAAKLRLHHGVAEAAFDPSYASVQTLADRVTPLGATMGNSDLRVGCPLRVHRRCHEPMFSISNRISYGGTMVLGRKPLNTSDWTGEIPDWGPGGHPSAWFDTPFGRGEGHWVPAQGRVLLNMLLRMVAQYPAASALKDGKGEPLRDRYLLPSGMPNAFVITPFRSIRTGLISMFRDASKEFRARNPAITAGGVLDWVEGPEKKKGSKRKGGHVGTLHTFQGREAPTVFLALGCTEESRTAVSWAGGTPNMLNVAATRAEDSFYVVGNHGLWSTAMPFKQATTGPISLEVLPVPEFVGTVPDIDNLERIDTLKGHLKILMDAIGKAKEAVHISSPYLSINAVTWGKPTVLDLIKAAVRRPGPVQVHIYNDPGMTKVPEAARNLEKAVVELAAAGATVHKVDNVHSKVLCVDDREIVEGSFNWLGASREGTYRREESSFRYTGMAAPELINKALAQLRGTMMKGADDTTGARGATAASAPCPASTAPQQLPSLPGSPWRPSPIRLVGQNRAFKLPPLPERPAK